MSGGWLSKRLGPPKTMTSNSELMGTTVQELEKSMFKGFLKVIEKDRNIGQEASATGQNVDPQPRNNYTK
jgi:hypothetical protein